MAVRTVHLRSAARPRRLRSGLSENEFDAEAIASVPVVTQLHRTQLRSLDCLQSDIGDGISDEGRMFAAIHLDGVEAGVAGLAGDGRAVGAVSGALGDESGA